MKKQPFDIWSIIYWSLIIICIIFLIVIIVGFNCSESFQSNGLGFPKKNKKDKKDKKTLFGFQPPPSRTVIQRFIDWIEGFSLEGFSAIKSTKPKFTAPLSLTNIKNAPLSKTTIKNNDKKTPDYLKEVIKEFNKDRKKGIQKNTIREILKDIAHHDEKGHHTKHLGRPPQERGHFHYEKGNILSFPTFFDCRDKWPGCLPEPLFQGTCGSCWAFAISTCLSARYYIESCGNTGCNNYPQLNLEALDVTLENINNIYKFRKITLSNIHRYVDVNNNYKITKKEWLNSIRRAHKTAIEGSGFEKFYAMEVLLYVLDYQSMGGIHFNKKQPNLDKLLARGEKTFKLWESNGSIDIKKWQTQWLSQPIPLSAEKIVSCCYPHCYERGSSLFHLSKEEILQKSTPQCVGGTLIDGWKLIRDTGTTTSICIGYNLDSWEEGEPTPNCHELQGPNYGYCSGYVIHTSFWSKNLDRIMKESEEHDLDPITPNDPEYKNLPWINPQLFRFRAKNAYEVNDDMVTIQREIIERGPVTTGYAIYPDFQYEFGAKGMGGQLYKPGTDPLGSSAESLIYIWNGKGEQIGGHAITITGWGTYHSEDNKIVIPYWICLNSWGREWGTSGYPEYNNRSGLPNKMSSGGYFWMVRGIDNCSFEKNVVAGQPNMENISFPGTTKKYGWGLPYPELHDIKLIPPFENNILTVDDLTVQMGPFEEGGGSYNRHLGGKNWAITPMVPPSPFIFFWPEERPLYCLGTIQNNLEDTYHDRFINLDKNTSNKIERIRKIVSHPLIVLDDEQLQIVESIEDFSNTVKSLSTIKKLEENHMISYKVNRGVDNSIIKKHKKGTLVKIFPFKELSVEDLKQFPLCDTEYSHSIQEIGDSSIQLCAADL